jgi:hypothetical protein
MRSRVRMTAIVSLIRLRRLWKEGLCLRRKLRKKRLKRVRASL